MGEKTASSVIKHMKPILARHGIPEEIVADNMPYNSREFQQFAKDWGFKVTTTSPTYPQSNGMSEKAVQTVKKILKKSTDPFIGLLEYRNTPISGMSYTPMQLLVPRYQRVLYWWSRELPQESSTNSRETRTTRSTTMTRDWKHKTKSECTKENNGYQPWSLPLHWPQDGQTYHWNRRHLKTDELPQENMDKTEDDIVPFLPPHNGEPQPPQNFPRWSSRTRRPPD